jgi:hypothetical protein
VLAREPLGRPDTTIDGVVVGALDVRAASVRGLAGRYDGKARQDEYCLGAAGSGLEWLVVGVADGVGSGPYSHDAAVLAARYGCRNLVEQLEQTGSLPETVDWSSLIEHVSAAIYAAGRRRIQSASANDDDGSDDDDQEEEHQRISDAMASTACYAIIATEPGDDDSFAAHVFSFGDSSVWVREATGWRCIIGGKNQDAALTSGEVVALPSSVARLPLPVSLSVHAGVPLLIVTDGVGDALGAGDDPVARFLAEVWREPPDPLTFAAQVGFARRSFTDDRTCVAVWPREQQ